MAARGEALEVVGLAGAAEGPPGRRSRHGSATRAWRGRAGSGAGWPIRPPASWRASCPTGSPAARRRIAVVAASRPAASSTSRTRSTSAGSQRWARATARTSGAARRMYGRRSRWRTAVSSGGNAGGAGGFIGRSPSRRRVPGWTENTSSSVVERSAGLVSGEMVEDRREIGLGEASCPGREREGRLDPLPAQERRELERPGHLGPHPGPCPTRPPRRARSRRPGRSAGRPAPSDRPVSAGLSRVPRPSGWSG